MTNSQREALTPTESASYGVGAKVMYSCFFILIFLVWSLKGCLVFLFLDLTRDTGLHRYVQVVGIVSAIACLVATVTQATHCLPVQRNWQILPDPGRECSTGYKTNIVIATGNALTDALLLFVPFHILRHANMRLWRKTRIAFLLSPGLFVMGIAITRCILSIGSAAAVALASVWAQREALVAIFAVNAPLINPVFKREFWGMVQGDDKPPGPQRPGEGDAQDELVTFGRLRAHKKRPGLFSATCDVDLETGCSRSSRESTSELVNVEISTQHTAEALTHT